MSELQNKRIRAVMKGEFLQTIFKGMLVVGRKLYEILYALFMSVVRVKLLIRISALLLAVVLWHDNQKKFEKSQTYYKLAVQSGLESKNEDVQQAARELIIQIEKDQKKREASQQRRGRGNLD